MIPLWITGEAMATLVLAFAMFHNYIPYEFLGPLQRYTQKIIHFFHPYIHITFHEYPSGDGFERSKAFSAIERYLNAKSVEHAKRLKASVVTDRESGVVLAMADQEEVMDEYGKVKVWWASRVTVLNRQTISILPRQVENMNFRLTFHVENREVVVKKYLRHVLDAGEAIAVEERIRKLHTNSRSDQGWEGGGSMWSHVAFRHPATFDTLAIDPAKKVEIVKDLATFSAGKDYYAKIGKAWKRGYLLYGPPGTGKSTMIAAMANFLKYDIYDLELTAVKDNTELRKLLIDTTSKSIIVIEDIDCSLDLTGQREEEETTKKQEEKKDDPVTEKIRKLEDKNSYKTSQVTLSGLLNFIDGLWSACAEGRIIVFTTNHVDRLDPALIRRGRMDKHIELAYCGFEAFKILAKNYLNLNVDHSPNDMFVTISELLDETKMTPADVAENLMPKSSDEDARTCLRRLISALQQSKEEATMAKAEEKSGRK